MSAARTAVVAGVCVVAGAVAGIAGSAAAPSHRAAAPNGAARTHMHFGMRIGRFGGPPVHAQAVIPNQAGTGFDTLTIDGGSFQSVSGDQLTIKEGTPKATYKVATFTVPSSAKIMRDGSAAKLTDLRSGDTVNVLQSSAGTFAVRAHSAGFEPQRGGWREHGGPDGPPPPGGAGAPGAP